MEFLILLVAFPLTYLIVLLVLFFKSKRTGLLFSLVCFALAIATGLWSIFQSRSSTAGIGVLILPFAGVLAGTLGWAFLNFKSARPVALRVLSWACLIGVLAMIGYELNSGLRTISLNQIRDAEQQARSKRIEQNEKLIVQLLASHPGRESIALAQFIAEHSQDTEMLLPALANKFAAPDDLDHYARKDELSLTLSALRNPNCRSETLTRIYRTHSYPDYFFQTLAAHPHTPPEILREIYNKKPRSINGLDLWLAKNPATPLDIVLELTDSTDVNVIQSLLQNPNLNCEMLRRIQQSIQNSSRPDDSYSISRLAEVKPQLCH